MTLIIVMLIISLISLLVVYLTMLSAAETTKQVHSNDNISDL